MQQERTATFLCPHCSALTLHEALSDTEGKREKQTVRGESPLVVATYINTHVIFRCVGCSGDTYCLVRYQKDERRLSLRVLVQAEWSEALGDGKGTILFQYPIINPKPHQAINAEVSKAMVEAEKCLSVGAHNACAVMTRRAIHSMCDERKAEGSDLAKKLRFLRDRHLITPDLCDWADSLRVLGRDGAHPEFPEVTQADAEDGVRLLREIVKYVYILPFERSQRRRLNEPPTKKGYRPVRRNTAIEANAPIKD